MADISIVGGGLDGTLTPCRRMQRIRCATGLQGTLPHNRLDARSIPRNATRSHGITRVPGSTRAFTCCVVFGANGCYLASQAS